MFSADAVAKTKMRPDGRLEVTMADRQGRMCTVSMSADVADVLRTALEETAVGGRTAGPRPTKLPTRFAVGTARYEPLVLVRFEDDVAYGLDAPAAARLGTELLEQAESVEVRPPAARQ
jgi:hypothetical protein